MHGKSRRIAGGIALGALLALGAPSDAAGAPRGKWLDGDFHQHTLYTDGSTPFSFVMAKSAEYGLDWWANSEHGGGRNRDGNGHFWADPAYYPVNPILGDVSGSPQLMWRWQSLRDFVFPDVLVARTLFPDRRIFSGVEWNVPGHEHCSVAVVGDDASAISAFEFQFDGSDNDTSRAGEPTPFGPLAKRNGRTYPGAAGKPHPERHADAVAGCGWMQEQYDAGRVDNAWIIFAHVERDGAWSPASGGGYNIEHFRDLNNAGPDVCFGFEGAPGHQANRYRGFGNANPADDFGGTYGGVGHYTAHVGGLWDALLGEGRRWFNFANSDYHRHHTAGGDDFYPGEYQRTWVRAVDTDGDGAYSLDEVGDGLRSGNAWFVQGDLIDHLDFTAQARRRKAAMGGSLTVRRGEDLKLKIRFRSPERNANGDAPAVDHIQLIAGEVTGPIAPGDPAYASPVNPTTRVIATFTSRDWERDDEGYAVIVHHLKNLGASAYFRLRGTNLAPNTPFETDAEGSPLADRLVTENLGIDGAAEAWRDLWFYSNPIFVTVTD